MALSAELRLLAQQVETVEQHRDRITVCAFVLCRTLGYTRGEGGPAFVGPPTVAGFPDTVTAVQQLLAAIDSPPAPRDRESQMLDMLRRVTDLAHCMNGEQHAGNRISAEQWRDLNDLTTRARAFILEGREEP